MKKFEKQQLNNSKNKHKHISNYFVFSYLGLHMHKQLLIGHVECLLFYSVHQTQLATRIKIRVGIGIPLE